LPPDFIFSKINRSIHSSFVLNILMHISVRHVDPLQISRTLKQRIKKEHCFTFWYAIMSQISPQKLQNKGNKSQKTVNIDFWYTFCNGECANSQIIMRAISKSISSIVYEQLLQQYYFGKKSQSQTGIREKLCKPSATLKQIKAFVKCWWNRPLYWQCETLLNVGDK